MAGPQSPIGSRRRLGAELRKLRTAAGMTLDEVAAQMTCSTSKISRLETGKGIPKVPDVRELMRIYGAVSEAEQAELLRLVHDGREHGWWEPLTDGIQPERFVLDVPGRYTALENDASTVRSFDPSIVPGLLQTEDYMRAVMVPLLPDHSDHEVDQLVALRLKRQEALARRDPAPMALVAVLDEAVLNRQVGGPDVMAEQLDHLCEIARSPNVELRVLPYDAGVLRAHTGQFALLEIPAALGSDVVYIEGHAGESFLENEQDVDLYREVHADAVRRALSADGSMQLIAGYAVERRAGAARA